MMRVLCRQVNAINCFDNELAATLAATLDGSPLQYLVLQKQADCSTTTHRKKTCFLEAVGLGLISGQPRACIYDELEM